MVTCKALFDKQFDEVEIISINNNRVTVKNNNDTKVNKGDMVFIDLPSDDLNVGWIHNIINNNIEITFKSKFDCRR